MLGLLAYSEYTKSILGEVPVSCFIMTARYPPLAVGKTHASSVMPLVKSRLATSLTLTRLLVPLKDKFFPNFPDVFQVAPPMVPLFPLPEASAVVLPAPSSKPKATSKPDPGVGGGVGAVAVNEAVIFLFAFIVTVAGLVEPVKSPDQPENV